MGGAGENPTGSAAWLSPSWPPLCPQGLALCIAERWKLTRARLRHRHTLLRGALRSWVVGSSAGPSVTPCLGWDGGWGFCVPPSVSLPLPEESHKPPHAHNGGSLGHRAELWHPCLAK